MTQGPRHEIDPARSAQMALVRSRNTKPELRVRRLLHAQGLRYRLHAKDLPGRPDIVFRSARLVVFVHGCFWHRHDDPECKLARMPKSRVDFWKAKLTANADRDRRICRELGDLGWRVAIVWECQLGQIKWLNEIEQLVHSRADSACKDRSPTMES